MFGFALVVLLGISSLPSVTQTLSWKEFAWIQSGLGNNLTYVSHYAFKKSINNEKIIFIDIIIDILINGKDILIIFNYTEF